MTYKYGIATWDTSVWAVTIGGIILSGVMSYRLVTNIFDISMLELFILVSLWLGPIACYLYAPIGYSLSAESISIHRLIGNITIDKSQITSIKRRERFNETTMRIFASGGLFGYFGVFKLKNGDRATLYCTQFKNVIVVKTLKQTFVISPANIEGFCENIAKIRAFL
jgi:hypothetical protein